MCICFLMCPEADASKDKRAGRTNMFATSMSNAPCANFPIFCASYCCYPCLNFKLRQDAIEDMNNYICCQGYANFMCFKAGSVGDQGSSLCLCIESCCCAGLASSSTRQFVMDKYDLASDPCDRKIIMCSNVLQMLACVCHVLAMFAPEFRDLASCVDCIADTVFLTVMGCMNAQVDLELKQRKGGVTPAGGPVCAELVDGGAEKTLEAAPIKAEAMAERAESDDDDDDERPVEA